MTQSNRAFETSINDATGYEPEAVPSLTDFAEETGGAWPKGWYAAEVIEGYSTPKGKVWSTEDTLSKAGDSRNVRFCFRVTNGTQERTTFVSINYRESDFTAQRLAHIKQAREDHKGVRGKWFDDPDGQRSSLAVASVAGFENALGFALRNSEGRILPERAIGHNVDTRFTINADGYNDINAFDKAGTKAARKR